jgi:hypothetical protein
MAKERDVTIQKLVMFQLGDVPDGLVLVLGYATSQERLSSGEIDSFAIGMTQAKAAELGRALLEKSGVAPPQLRKGPTEH